MRSSGPVASPSDDTAGGGLDQGPPPVSNAHASAPSPLPTNGETMAQANSEAGLVPINPNTAPGAQVIVDRMSASLNEVHSYAFEKLTTIEQKIAKLKLSIIVHKN